MKVIIKKSEVKKLSEDKYELSARIEGMDKDPFTLFYRVGGGRL